MEVTMTTYIIVFLTGMLVGQWLLIGWTMKLLADTFRPEE
jgi:hypothetical protein